MSALILSPEEVRVLGALVEKSLTTPQYYPMTVNAISNACNQKNCRSPVMQLSEVAVAQALSNLLEQDLVDRDDVGSRVTKWSHQFRTQMLLKKPTQAVLVTLMLRGPQTPAELLRNAQGLQGPDSAAGIAQALEDLADRGHPLVRQLPRAAGQKEARWIHLLCGEPSAEELASWATEPSAAAPRNPERVAELEARLAALEARIGVLEARLDEVL